MTANADLGAPRVCAVGGVDDGSLRVCCSSHKAVMCARHYAETHFVEVGRDIQQPPCNASPNDGSGA